MKIYVFCDNSNIFIEGKWAAGRAEGLKKEHPEFRIDYGQLLNICAEKRTIASANLYGSRPPENDSLWKAITRNGWKVNVIDRNLANKEKGLDIKIALDIQRLILSQEETGTIVLLAGDGDYQTLIEEIHEKKWKIEIWFYSNVAQSISMMADRFENLDNHLHEIRLK